MIQFSKVHGIGNDFVFLDGIKHDLSTVDLAALAVQMCRPHFAVGADGLLVLQRGDPAEFRMVMHNPDGSLSEMCGNGIRCLAKKVFELGYASGSVIECETGAGILKLQLQNSGAVTVDMGKVSFDPLAVGLNPAHYNEVEISIDGRAWRGTCVSTGNPHIVIFVENVESIDLANLGPKIENHPQFLNRINVQIAQIISRSELKMRTWERGAGLTLACGTGACAVAAVANFSKLADSKVKVNLPGGNLEIEISEARHAIMSGFAETVFEGNWLATLPTLK